MTFPPSFFASSMSVAFWPKAGIIGARKNTNTDHNINRSICTSGQRPFRLPRCAQNPAFCLLDSATNFLDSRRL
jgi:hypothetical protein